jgi:hypothetical protein
MCGNWAYESYQEYSAVFPEIAEILNASGIEATVKENYDKTGLLVEVTLPNRTVTVLSEDGEHWSIDLGGSVIELGIPVENRDATAIVAAVLKAIGK